MITFISTQRSSYALGDPHMHSVILISTQQPSLWHHYKFPSYGLLAIWTEPEESAPYWRRWLPRTEILCVVSSQSPIALQQSSRGNQYATYPQSLRTPTIHFTLMCDVSQWWLIMLVNLTLTSNLWHWVSDIDSLKLSLWHWVSVTVQAGTVIPRNNRRKIRVVRKELCYGKAEMLEDVEEAARWWRYNLGR